MNTIKINVNSNTSHSCPPINKDLPEWIKGTIRTAVGIVFEISTEWKRADYIEHFKCRISAYRMNYTVKPGLYAVGNPDKNSDVLASSNYKLSFDILRRSLKELNAWILVLDTKGINVWCAAGEGTFGTNELIKRMSAVNLKDIVSHRRIILPQLGAPGINSYIVKQKTGFKGCFGPVKAEDIQEFINSDYKASKEMRTIKFSLMDRLVLTPMEINPAMKKFPIYAILILIIFGLQPSGIIFKDAMNGGTPFLLLGIVSILAGAFFTPVLLPFVPLRSFAIKGWIVGIVAVLLTLYLTNILDNSSNKLILFTCIFFPLISSYIALQFTGSTTFTGISGVKRELKYSIPVYISGASFSLILLLIYKIETWRIL